VAGQAACATCVMGPRTATRVMAWRTGHACGVRYEEVHGLWREGERRLAGAEPEVQRWLQRVTDALVAELRRRLGGPFTTDELARLYSDGTDWCFDLAARVAPGEPRAWDMPTVAGAAFARYAREASDYRVPGERPPAMEPE
jgi:uncharacterized protein (DUF2236 family)